MRNVLIKNGAILVWMIDIAELLIGIFSLLTGFTGISILVMIVCIGLVIDATIMALGSRIGEGLFLQRISQIRYILHGVSVPLLIPISFYMYGIESKAGKIVLWILIIAIIGLGILMGFKVKTEAAEVAGVLRYTTSKETPKYVVLIENLLSFGGVLPLIVIGIMHLIVHKNPFLFLSGISMLFFSGLAPATKNLDLNFIVTMIGEVFMVLFLMLELLFR